MGCLIFPCQETVAAESLPPLAPGAFRNELLDLCLGRSWRLLAFFAAPREGGRAELMAVLGRPGELCALRSEELGEFESMARDCPSIQLYEREIYESQGIVPRNHPWLKPVRSSPDAPGSGSCAYDFYRVQGDHVHEVGVGPIHAGIIEPGHFRFQCYGENVLHLEIALGYQHRGMEKLLLGLPGRTLPGSRRLRLVECIAGDASVAHATAQCVLWERLLARSDCQPGPRDWRIRRIGLELERLACHCGDLGAIAGDTGFLPSSAWNGRIRGDFLNLTAEICGNRFGREYLRIGGVDRDIGPDLCGRMLERLAAAGRDALGSSEVMFASASVHERMAGTGALSQAQAVALGLVGVAARACGVACDVRFSSPLADLPLYGARERLESSGDVLARARVRLEEMRDSLALVRGDLEWLAANAGDAPQPAPETLRLPPGRLGLAQVEGWRGEICHVGLTGADGDFRVCKFIDPSFHNWAGLALAMRDGQISDFPLCNKSFNLSYCGFDL